MSTHFDAFISYRHAELDTYVAETLQRELEHFRLPRRLARMQGKNKKTRIKHIFRDRDSLALASDLSEPIYEALRNTDYLIVICTPRVKESPWCMREIETFLQTHDRDHVLTVLAEGEPWEAFPDILTIDHAEPLAADVRGTSKREIRKKIHAELLRIAAVMFGYGYEELRQRHKEQVMRQYFRAAVVVAAISFTFGMGASHQAVKIENQAEKINGLYLDNLSKQIELSSEKSKSFLAYGYRQKAIDIIVEAFPQEENVPAEVDGYLYSALSECLGVYENGSSTRPIANIVTELNIVETAISEDGRYLLVETTDGKESVWSLETYQKLCDLTNPIDLYNVRKFAFAGDRLLIARDDQLFCVDLQTGKECYAVPADGIVSVVNLDDESVLCFSIYGTMEKRSVETGGVLNSLQDDEIRMDMVLDCAFSDDREVLYVEFYANGVYKLVCFNTRLFCRTGCREMEEYYSGDFICVGRKLYMTCAIPEEDKMRFEVKELSLYSLQERILYDTRMGIERLYAVGEDRILIVTESELVLYDLQRKCVMNSYVYSHDIACITTNSAELCIYYTNGICEAADPDAFFFYDKADFRLPYVEYEYVIAANGQYVTKMYATDTVIIYSDRMPSSAGDLGFVAADFDGLTRKIQLKTDCYETEDGAFRVNFEENYLLVYEGNEQIGSYYIGAYNDDPDENYARFAISKDGLYLFVCTMRDSVRIISTQTGETLGETADLYGTVVYRDIGAEYFVIGGQDEGYLYSKETLNQIATIHGFAGYDEKTNHFIMMAGNFDASVYSVPFYTLEELKSMAQ